MSMPAQAKLPVPARNCQSPWLNASRRIASRFHGSRPTTKGAIASHRGVHRGRVGAGARLAPADEPVVGRRRCTSTSLTPSRATCELTSRCVYGTLTGIVSSARDLHSVCSKLGQDLVVVRADEERVLEPDAAPARQVDGGLEREHHALLEALLAVRRDPRLLRPRSADAVPGVVAVRRAVLGEHLAHPPVDVLATTPGGRVRSRRAARAGLRRSARASPLSGVPTKTAFAVSDQPPSIHGEVSVRTRSPGLDDAPGRDAAAGRGRLRSGRDREDARHALAGLARHRGGARAPRAPPR